MVVLLGVLLIITEQYLEPTIANSLVPLRQLNWPHMIGTVSTSSTAPCCVHLPAIRRSSASCFLPQHSCKPNLSIMMSTCVRHFTRHMLRCGSNDEST